MTNEQLDQMLAKVRALCPDYVGIEATHLGNFRVKLTAVTVDQLRTSILLGLDDDKSPEQWASRFAAQLHTEWVV